jgi:hypothetical protein
MLTAMRGFSSAYAAYHLPRYEFVLKLLSERGLRAGLRALDIGPSELTTLIREKFDMPVDTIGFGADQIENDGRHFQFDLNAAQEEDQWRRGLPCYDFVIMAEVIEHLHTAPEIVLAFVKSLMSTGSTLILQTPNAASLTKRIKLLLGKNPYERIRLDTSDPGHFREYTLKELRGLLTDAGFEIEECVTAFYFDARFAHHEPGRIRKQPLTGGAKNFFYRLLPSRFREGITIVARRR